jgi:hypothetical protein
VGLGVCSSASSSSKTRSADAMPDWNTFIHRGQLREGLVNWREYWMKACTSPRRDARSPPHAADHGDDT